MSEVNEKLEDFKGILNIITSKMVLPLYLSFWLLDIIYVPHYKWEFLIIRGVIIPVALVTNYIIKKIEDIYLLQKIALMYVFFLAGIINLMIFIVGPNALYYNCLHLVAIGSLSFIPFSGLYFFLSSLAIYGPYYLIELTRISSSADYVELAVNSFIVFSVLLITLIIKLYHKHFRERDKALRLALENEVGKTKKAEKELTLARDIALESTKEKSIFLANMSHEIRTPLTSIIGFSKMLVSKKLDETSSTKYTNTIIKNSEHLLHLINDVLDFSKIEANKLEISKSNILLFEFIYDISNLMEESIKRKGLEYKVNYEYPLPESIYTDEIRLKQVIINLCSNALKFSSEGHVHITISYNIDNNLLNFAVSDTGIGLKEDQIRSIFNSFSQADATTSKKYGGTGLGLAISKQLVSKLGGALAVDSVFGNGSCFHFGIDPGCKSDLEFVNESPILTIENKNFQSALDNSNLEGHVLLVEDTIDNQVLIKSYLEDMGAETTIANNGREALDFIIDKTYDLILMDMQMPTMSGLDALIEARNSNYNKPIVMLTGNAIEEEKRRCELAGCNGFITKPIDIGFFTKTISKFLRKKKGSKLQKIVDDSEFEHASITVELDKDPIFSTLLGKSKKYDELIVKFVGRLDGFVTEIELAVQNQETDKIKDATHRLKGIGGNYGYLMLSEICDLIDQLIDEENLSLLAERVKHLQVVKNRIVLGLDIYVSKLS